MKLAIMQPYFLPYSGYFKLISSVDVFVVYDNIKYTKKGWINRNRIQKDGHELSFSVSLKKDSDYLNVVDRRLSFDFSRQKLLSKFTGAYSSAPYFKEIYPYLEKIIMFDEDNLFSYIHHSLLVMMELLDIKTKVIISSTLDVDDLYKGEDKVLAICKALGSDVYINAIGGQELYSKDVFSKNGISLSFLNSKEIGYKQSNLPYIPYLSIIDPLMFNSLDTVRECIRHDYSLV